MKPKLKIKDLVLIALLTAIYLLIYMASMVPISLLGPYGHAISPGVCGPMATPSAQASAPCFQARCCCL